MKSNAVQLLSLNQNFASGNLQLILGQSGPDSKSANYQLIWTGKRIQQNQNDSEQVYQWPLWTIKDLGILDSRKIGPTGGSAPGKKSSASFLTRILGSTQSIGSSDKVDNSSSSGASKEKERYKESEMDVLWIRHESVDDKSNVTTTAVVETEPSSTQWICSICQHVNSLMPWMLKMSSDSTSSTSLPSRPPPACEECGVMPKLWTEMILVCPQCTFHQRWEEGVRGLNGNRVLCSICEYLFYPPLSASSSTTIPESKSIVETRFRFLEGGCVAMYSALKQACTDRPWDRPKLGGSSPASTVAPTITPVAPTAAGITGIQRQAQAQQERTETVIRDGFRDIDALMTHAGTLVQLAAQLVRQVQPDSEGDGKSSLDTTSTQSSTGTAMGPQDHAMLYRQLMTLGLGEHPITKASLVSASGAGGSEGERVYYRELAWELGRFLAAVFGDENVGDNIAGGQSRQNLRRLMGTDGRITLTDLYFYYNKARNGAMISPQDLLKALQTLLATQSSSSAHSLGTIQLKTYSSGLKVVIYQSSREGTTSRPSGPELALERIRERRSRSKSTDPRQWGMSAMDLGLELGVSTFLAKEYLLEAEEKGWLCRDDSVEGLKFFENLFTLMANAKTSSSHSVETDLNAWMTSLRLVQP